MSRLSTLPLVKFALAPLALAAMALGAVSLAPAQTGPITPPSGPGVTPPPVIAGNPLVGTWKRVDKDSPANHIVKFGADGRYQMGMNNEPAFAEQGTYQFADGMLTLAKSGGQPSQYRVAFTGPDRVQWTYTGNGYQTEWVRQGGTGGGAPVAPPSPQTISLIGAWEEAGGTANACIFYFMTNGRFLMITHNNGLIQQEAEGSYQFTNGVLRMELNGKTVEFRVESTGAGRLKVTSADGRTNSFLVKRVGDVRLRRANGSNLILSNA